MIWQKDTYLYAAQTAENVEHLLMLSQEQMNTLEELQKQILPTQGNQLVEEQFKELNKKLDDLLKNASQLTETNVQRAEKIYNIENANNSVFQGENQIFNIENQTIIYKEREVSRLLTTPPFNPPIFIGRAEELKAVHEKLFAGQNFLMLVNGQGGIGKTSFAAKYWEKYQNEYSHLAFLYVENGIANALLSLSRKLGLQFTTETQAEQLQILIETVANLQKPCLLILDNANNESDLNENIVWLRKCPNFHILMTSRLADFGYAQKYPLGTLDKPQALELFKKHYELLQDSEKPLFEEIYEAVGGNTLVLEILAKNLSNFNNKLRTRYTLQNLKDDLQKSLLKLSMSKEVKTEYQAKGTGLRQETPEAIILAMYDLTDLQESEIALLSIFAVLPAENIEFETLAKFLIDENLDETLLPLAQKGWIEQNETAFKISPVVQEIVRHKNQDRLFADCEKMIRFLIGELDSDNIHKENYKYATLYSQYAESVVSTMEKDLLGFQNLTGLMLLERIGSFHETTGNLTKALDFYEKYNELSKKLVAQHHENTDYKNGLAISYNYLGNTHLSLGDLNKALNNYEKYNQLSKELYEENNKNVKFKGDFAISYSKLGDTQASLGNLAKALEFFEKRSQLGKELYEAYPANVGFKNGLAISYQYLGKTHSSLGNLEKALEFFEKYNNLEKELYEAYPANVGFKNGLALSYQWLGWHWENKLDDKQKARPYYLESKKLLAELVQSFPAYVEFQENLQWVEGRLKELE